MSSHNDCKPEQCSHQSTPDDCKPAQVSLPEATLVAQTSTEPEQEQLKCICKPGEVDEKCECADPDCLNHFCNCVRLVLSMQNNWNRRENE